MDMNADAASIAARRVDMERVRPVARKPRPLGNEGLEARPRERIDGDEERDTSDEPGESQTDEAAACGDADEQAGVQPRSDAPYADTGEGHVLDVRV